MKPAMITESSETTMRIASELRTMLRVNSVTGASASALSISATITQSRPSMSSGA